MICSGLPVRILRISWLFYSPESQCRNISNQKYSHLKWIWAREIRWATAASASALNVDGLRSWKCRWKEVHRNNGDAVETEIPTAQKLIKHQHWLNTRGEPSALSEHTSWGAQVDWWTRWLTGWRWRCCWVLYFNNSKLINIVRGIWRQRNQAQPSHVPNIRKEQVSMILSRSYNCWSEVRFVNGAIDVMLLL